MRNARFALRYRAIALTALAAAACGSCTRSSDKTGVPPGTSPPAPNAEAASAAPPPIPVNRQSLDEAVIEAALVDLVAGTDERSDILRREQGLGTVLFSGVCRGGVDILREELSRADSREWHSLEAADRNAARLAADMIINRVKHIECVAAFRFKDRRISVWEESPAASQPSSRFDGPRPIHAAPPGYADEHKLAVIIFDFAWGRHGGEATYVLRFDGQKWHVISRNFAIYV